MKPITSTLKQIAFFYFVISISKEILSSRSTYLGHAVLGTFVSTHKGHGLDRFFTVSHMPRMFHTWPIMKIRLD